MLGLGLGLGIGGGSGGAPVIPSSGLLGNFRLDKLVTLNGGNVSAVGDLVGSNTWSQGTAGNQPLFVASGTIAGLPCVRMQASGVKYLAGTLAATLHTACTLVVIGKLTSSGGSTRMASMFANAAVNDFDAGSFTLVSANTTQQAIVDSGGVSKSTLTTSDQSLGVSGVFSARLNGTNSICRLNGTDGTTVADATALGLDKFSVGIGWQTSAVVAPVTTFDVYEVAIYSTSLASFAALSAYTTARYGLAA